MKREEPLWFLCPRLRDSNCYNSPWILERLKWYRKHRKVINKETQHCILNSCQNNDVMHNCHPFYFLLQALLLNLSHCIAHRPRFPVCYVCKITSLPFHHTHWHFLSCFSIMRSSQWLLEATQKVKTFSSKSTDNLFEYSFGECSQHSSNVIMAPLPSLSLYLIYLLTYIN